MAYVAPIVTFLSGSLLQFQQDLTTTTRKLPLTLAAFTWLQLHNIGHGMAALHRRFPGAEPLNLASCSTSSHTQSSQPCVCLCLCHLLLARSLQSNHRHSADVAPDQCFFSFFFTLSANSRSPLRNHIHPSKDGRRSTTLSIFVSMEVCATPLA